MQGLPLHPVIVHLPVGLSLVVPIVALGLTIALWRGLVSRRVWLVAVALQALMLAGGLAAMKTGENEEERVERVIGERTLESHEERAEAFLWAAGVTLALSGVVIAVGPNAAVVAAGATTIAALVTLGFAYRVGHSGGELVYKHGAASAYVQGVAANGEAAPAGMRRSRRGDDDD